jgi:hypothetical protein
MTFTNSSKNKQAYSINIRYILKGKDAFLVDP